MNWNSLAGPQQKLAKEYNQAREERIPAFQKQDKRELEELGRTHEESEFPGKAMSVGLTWDKLSQASRHPEASQANTASDAPDQSVRSAETAETNQSA